jgi:hypothetical protein
MNNHKFGEQNNYYFFKTTQLKLGIIVRLRINPKKYLKNELKKIIKSC